MDLDRDACYRALLARDPRFDGRFFVGVLSTGIYCRPICPARTPKRRHVVFFPTAAAAQEAGFRPCLRCRPETAPDLAAWRGTSNTVARALALIERGALDEDGVESLAERLGVGARQLRRLFRQHLGASPVAVAQTKRVLLAKQLIHDTQLPMTQVALAAGFGSIRRFNETFRDLYGRPPGALRRAAGNGAAGADVVVRLPYREPYDWPAMLAFLRARAIPGVESVSGGVYSRTIAFDGHCGIIRVAAGSDRTLHVTAAFPKLDRLPSIIARLRRMFDLGADPPAIAAHLSEDAVLAPLVARRPGLRVPGAWDAFELAVRAVLGQQITVAAAAGLAGRLVAMFGEPLPAGICTDALTHVFPTPERLADADLSRLGMPRQRAAALAALAASVREDPHLFAIGRSLDDAVNRLREVPGIGEWTAQYIAMREMREADAFPVGDAGLLRAFAAKTGQPTTPAALLAHAERWRPWRAYAAQHLWAALAELETQRPGTRRSRRADRRPTLDVAAAPRSAAAAR
ncbi:MAG TPA: AlkA N-terminal domain-containing protein [Vicinamibacterales bacterium]